MTLNEILKVAGKSINDITKVYHGKDHWCRCGCGGNYFEVNNIEESRGFNRAINKMNKPDFEPVDKIDYGILNGYNYINIPTDNSTEAGKCYCVYFD